MSRSTDFWERRIRELTRERREITNTANRQQREYNAAKSGNRPTMSFGKLMALRTGVRNAEKTIRELTKKILDMKKKLRKAEAKAGKERAEVDDKGDD